ncbi:unnamed protein product, partial [Brassica oleracea var. botrytis]
KSLKNNRHFFSDFTSLLIPNELRTHLYSLPTQCHANALGNLGPSATRSVRDP